MKIFISILIILLSSVSYGIGERITSDGNAVSIETIFASSELFEIQHIQSADTMYLVHPNHPPQLLTRTSDIAWTIANFDFQRGPFLIENDSDVTITPSGTVDSITLTASSATFNENHIGALWQITHTVASTTVTGNFTGTGSSSTTAVQLYRSYTVNTHGKWTGVIEIQRSYDAGSNWATVGNSFSSASDGNLTLGDIEDVDDAIYRITCTAYTSGTCRYTLVANSFDLKGVVGITGFSDVNIVTATVKETLGGTTAVTTWSEGAWSPDEGYPSTVAVYEERLYFAGTKGSPQTIWMSRSKKKNWENFLVGVNDDNALSLTIVASQVNVIRWLAAQTELVIGTTGGEWTISAASATEPITPTNAVAKQHSTFGSAFVQAKSVNNEIYYLQRNAQKVRNISYSFAEDTWVSPDMTVLAEHITDEGIVDWAYQRNPYPMLWCVTSNGNLSVLTVMKDLGVVGWHLHTTDGDFKSVAVIPGTTEDRVWFVVERDINDVTVKYIEQLQPFDWGTSQTDFFFVDCGLEFDYGASVDISSITQANPCVVTSISHGFTEDDNVRIASVLGMVELNNNVYTVGTVVDVNSFQLQDSADVGDINSIDFTTYTSSGTVTQVENTFTIANLDSESVIISGDGGYYGTSTVDSNTVTLSEYYNTTQIGLAYTSRVKPMKLSSAGNPANYFGTTKRITEIVLRLFETSAVDVGDSWTSYDPVIFRDAADILETATPMYSDDKIIYFDGDYELAGNICIQSRLPVPFTLLGLRAELEFQR